MQVNLLRVIQFKPSKNEDFMPKGKFNNDIT